MTHSWCKICGTYHEPRSSSTCYIKKQRGGRTGEFRYPRVGALLAAPIYGIVATLPVGWLTDGEPASLIVFALVTPFAAWRMWPKKKPSPSATEEEEPSIAPGEGTREAPPAAEEEKSERKGALWRWTRRLLLGLAGLLGILGIGLVLYDIDILRYPSGADAYVSRYVDRLLDPSGYHEKKTEASLIDSSWTGSVVVEARDGEGWKAVQRHNFRRASSLDLAKWLPAERADAKRPTRRVRLFLYDVKLRFEAKAFERPTVVKALSIRRASDGRWHHISFTHGLGSLRPGDYSKALLEALATPRKAYVQQRPYASVKVFVDDETFAKLASDGIR